MSRLLHLLRASALAASLTLVSGYGALPAAGSAPAPAAAPLPAQPVQVGPEIAAFYRERGFAPIWVRDRKLKPEALALLSKLPRQPQLDRAVKAADSGDPNALTRVDLLLTRSWLDEAERVNRPPRRKAMHYVDAELAPDARPKAALLERLIEAPSLGSAIEETLVLNPVHDGLVRGLALYRARWSSLPSIRIGSGADGEQLRRRLGVAKGSPDLGKRLAMFQSDHGLEATGRADPATIEALNRGPGHYEQLIERNIERARNIPNRSGRYLLVDTASARMWTIEQGRVSGTMRVIVGKADMKTPVMAGLMRHVVLNPYWNLPPDLIRQRARKAVRSGAAAIRSERLEVLSDWSENPRRLDPGKVNWPEVAAGKRYVNLRQRPGPDNMMGEIKFMFPNELGIYLHDTPFKDHFRRDDRRISSGCVRLEDAGALARWLFGGSVPTPSGAPEEEVDLPVPVPVYIAYFTALPTRDGIRFQPDRYGLD